MVTDQSGTSFVLFWYQKNDRNFQALCVDYCKNIEGHTHIHKNFFFSFSCDHLKKRICVFSFPKNEPFISMKGAGSL